MELWNPEQISHFGCVSHEHIYQYVHQNKLRSGDLYLNLDQKRSHRKNKRLSRYQKEVIYWRQWVLKILLKSWIKAPGSVILRYIRLMMATENKHWYRLLNLREGWLLLKKTDAVKGAIIEPLKPINIGVR